MKTIQDTIYQAMLNHTESELALGWLRFEALRKLNPRAFRELWDKAMAGEKFDDLVDALIVEKENKSLTSIVIP